MTAKVLAEAMKRIETWPEEAQEELAGIALEMDAALNGNAYQPTPEELAGIDRGLRLADEGRFVSSDDVRAIFAKHRPA
jgi:predicted transcriptional regulator